MKSGIALFLAAAIATPLVSYAQDGKGTITDEQLTRMQQHLELTDEQIAEMRRIRDDGGTKKEVRAVLSDEQKAKAQEMKAARGNSDKGKSRKEGKSTVTDEQLSKMQEALGLSDEQLAEMRQIRDGGGSAKEVRAVLTEEQKAQVQARKQTRKKEKKGSMEE